MDATSRQALLLDTLLRTDRHAVINRADDRAQELAAVGAAGIPSRDSVTSS
jgi:hypothetical protein